MALFTIAFGEMREASEPAGLFLHIVEYVARLGAAHGRDVKILRGGAWRLFLSYWTNGTNEDLERLEEFVCRAWAKNRWMLTP